MTIYLTSDEHYGHNNIIAYCNRPFANVEEMNASLISNHNDVVGQDDIVYHLGDFCMNEKLVPTVLKQLNGTHYLVAGNHDRCHPVNKKWLAAKERYLLYGFAGVYQELFNFGGGFILNHMPYSAPNDASREHHYNKYRSEDRGSWLLHGHVHNAWTTKDRMINVGVDVWDYKPVRLEALIDIKRK